MPKGKRTHGPPPKKGRKMHTFAKLSTSDSAAAGGKPKAGQSAANNNSQNGKKTQNQNQAKQRKPIVPFGRGDRILLIGEGDFSFARSLVIQHKCRNVLATCYDDQETLRAKYPQAEGKNISDMLNAGHHHRHRSDDEEQESESASAPKQEEENQHIPKRFLPRVLYSVDARKLGSNSGGGKDVRNGFARMQRRQQHQQQQQKDKKKNTNTPRDGGPWDIICFNFPHVGGLSTDVNRQVRSNQELLVGFFKAAISLLSVPDSEDTRDDYSSDEEDFEYGSDGSEHKKEPKRTQPGQILVTLFESEPYTLWNIKDLARHAGLRVVTSFRFPWASYEGYAHARTLGEVEGKHGGRGGWKGEDREARMYVFESAQVEEVRPAGRKKRGRNDVDSEDSD